jgi:hypothetical protein
MRLHYRQTLNNIKNSRIANSPDLEERYAICRGKLHWTELLGKGILCINDRSKLSCHQKVYPGTEDEDRHQDQLEMFKDNNHNCL